MKVFSPKIKKNLIFSQKKAFLYFRKLNFLKKLLIYETKLFKL